MIRMTAVTRRTARPGTASALPNLPSRLGRLGRVRAKQTILERSSIETTNDGVHFVRIRRVDKSESLGLLRFGVANHFYRVRDQVFSAQPIPDVVRSYPNRQVAQKDRKAHSEIIFGSISGDLASTKHPSRHFHASTVPIHGKQGNPGSL